MINKQHLKTSAKRLNAALFGNPETTILENRVFTITQFLVLCASVMCMIQIILCRLSFSVFMVTAGAGGASLVMYFISLRNGAWRKLVIPGYVIFTMLLSILWFSTDGSNGGIGYFFFILSAATIILFENRKKAFPFFLLCVALLLLLIVEVKLPTLLVRYTSKSQRFFDVSFSLILCIVINGCMMYAVFIEYTKERAIKNRLLKDLAAEKEKVDRMVAVKERLLSLVCHDIANSLFNLECNAGALCANGETSKNLDAIRFSTGNISDIIDSVRAIRDFEDNKTSLPLGPVNVDAVLADIRSLFADRCANKNIELAIVKESAGSIFVLADAKIFLNQILGNIVSNALKFSRPETTVTIAVRQMMEETAISVCDRGVGFTPGVLQPNMSSETKKSTLGTAGERGTGFGMIVAVDFVARLKGRLVISSKLERESPNDHGTTVTIFLQNANA